MSISSLSRGTCITIGNFDGLHLGHQALINKAMATANSENLDFILMTFWPHPREVLPSKLPHTPLTGRNERMRLLENMCAGKIIELPFTTELAALSAQDFISEYLLPLKLRHLVVGHDFSLGKNREGNIQLLSRLSQSMNFRLTRVPALEVDGQIISSTRLRQYIKDGDVANAAKMLGRYYSFEGKVEHGFGRGAKLGFPTANIKHHASLLPANGVYATFASVGGAGRIPAMTNIGFNPTFAGSELSVETFLLDMNSDVYGQELRIEFVQRLRAEKKFSGPAELTAQIAADIERGRHILEAAQGSLSQ